MTARLPEGVRKLQACAYFSHRIKLLQRAASLHENLQRHPFFFLGQRWCFACVRPGATTWGRCTQSASHPHAGRVLSGWLSLVVQAVAVVSPRLAALALTPILSCNCRRRTRPRSRRSGGTQTGLKGRTWPAVVSTRQHTPAHVSTRQHTPAHVSTRQHTPAHASTHTGSKGRASNQSNKQQTAFNVVVLAFVSA